MVSSGNAVASLPSILVETPQKGYENRIPGKADNRDRARSTNLASARKIP
jgi:hypothetical protein